MSIFKIICLGFFVTLIFGALMTFIHEVNINFKDFILGMSACLYTLVMLYIIGFFAAKLAGIL